MIRSNIRVGRDYTKEQFYRFMGLLKNEQNIGIPEPLALKILRFLSKSTSYEDNSNISIKDYLCFFGLLTLSEMEIIGVAVIYMIYCDENNQMRVPQID